MMNKILKVFFVSLVGLVLLLGWFFYPRLNILTGFAAKNVCSCTFEAGRDLTSIEEQDNSFQPVSYARNLVDSAERVATASLWGIKGRKAVYREGIGCTLLPEKEKSLNRVTNIPQRIRVPSPLPYPYGHAAPVDTVFANMDYRNLKNAVESAFEPEKETRAVIVLHKDHLIAEHYAPGFSEQTKILGWSMTKSITNAVLGVLEQQGRIHLQQDALFKEWEKDSRAKINLKNLLQMNSGLEWDEDYTRISDVTKMLFLKEDMSQVQLKKKLSGEPSKSWNYSSGTTNLLSGFIRNQFDTHQEYLDFWYSALIDRIGMHSMMIETDFAGNYVGSSYAWATARDWAKFGLLYLNKGNWNGEQILNEEWVKFSAAPTNDSKGEYGAHFWLNAGGKYPNLPRDLFSANGFQGQYVFVIPSRDLVVVRFGLSEDSEFNVDSFLLKIIRSTDANPEIAGNVFAGD